MSAQANRDPDPADLAAEAEIAADRETEGGTIVPLMRQTLDAEDLARLRAVHGADRETPLLVYGLLAATVLGAGLSVAAIARRTNLPEQKVRDVLDALRDATKPPAS